MPERSIVHGTFILERVYPAPVSQAFRALDGREQPAWREQGTGDWLDALGRHLVEV